MLGGPSLKFPASFLTPDFSHFLLPPRKTPNSIPPLTFPLSSLITPYSVTVASSTIAGLFASAQTRLESLYARLPPALHPPLDHAFASLQSLAEPYLTYLPGPVASYLAKPPPPTSSNYLLQIVAPGVIILLLTMTSWRSYLGGRYSPFGVSPPSRSPPTVTEDDYHYMGPDDIVDPPRPRPTYSPNDGYFPSGRRGLRGEDENPEEPDILVLRHRSTTYPLHFPAFAIGEGLLRVGELRKLAAQETGTSNYRRIKLLYKGKVLKDDAVACREEGLKQNSELMCVITEVPVNGRSVDDSSSSADEEDMVRAERGDGLRVDVDGTLMGGGSGRKRKSNRVGKKAKRTSKEALGHPQANGHIGSSNPSGSNTPLNPIQNHTQSQPKRPTSPLDKLDELLNLYRHEFEPKCTLFLRSPPADSRARELEYNGLSESILTQVIMKTDAIETEGNQGLRERRRALVKEAQAMLNSLDAFMGKRPA